MQPVHLYHHGRSDFLSGLALAALAWLCLGVLLADAGAAEEAARHRLDRIAISELDAVPGSQGRGHSPQRQRSPASNQAEPALPPEATTHHSVTLSDRTLAFTAKVGASTFEDTHGVAVAEIGYFAYLLDHADRRTRPVTFVINGGPGAASAWLHIDALGPWRLPLTQADAHPTAPADLVPNAETWLDFTDLVFIDPVGTGYSRLASTDDAIKDKFWSVQGDINAIAVFIKRWLQANDRLDAPKRLVGESYGGFRAPRLAQTLQSMPGLALDAIILVSPAFATPATDFPGLGNALIRAAAFPSLAAAIAESKGPVSPEQLAAFEREAVSGYLPDVLAGPRDKAAVERLARRIAAVTGLQVETVRQLGPRSSPQTFLGEIDRASGRVSSNYDATEKRVAAYDGPDLVDGGDDLRDLSLRLERAMAGLVEGPFGWRPQRQYRVLARGVGWSWKGQDSVTALRTALVRDPTLRVLVAHGYADLVTPYFRTKLILDQLPTIGGDNNGRVRLNVYGGGHMLYTRDGSRAQLRADVDRLYTEIAPAIGAH
ncbi:MAG TPA: peptidase S10 [Hyphomicrobiaceae bacterium]|nr:peptidase S10 [Hyphomicrobiaceae bacterium]